MQIPNAGDRDNIDDTRGDRLAAHDGKFLTTVNDMEVSISDPAPIGRQVLGEAGFLPADDHVLIQLLPHRTRSVGLDEQVDLRQSGAEAFWAFKSDRLFRFTIDDRGYEWGAAKITEPELRRIATVRADEVLTLKTPAKDIVLTDDDIVDLGDSGTEHIYTGKRLVTVYLDTGTEKNIPSGTYTTEQLIRVLDVQDGYLLNVLNPEGELVTLQPEQKTEVKQGMRFFSQVPQGGSS